MPELPEVETTVKALREPLLGKRITAVETDWPGHIGRPDLAELRYRIQDSRFEALGRRGKYLIFTMSNGETLIVHLRMTGHLSVVPASRPRHKHVHTVFVLENGEELRFRDQRKFGKVYLVRDPEEVVGGLGPEPLAPEFTVDVLQGRLNGRSRALKPLLLDQTFIAGVGNIYADESLFYARLHPLRRADTLSSAEVAALHAAIQRALRLGIAREGASIDMYVKPDGTRGDMQNAVNVFRRTGLPCYDCGIPIERVVLGGRSTHFCPQCQSLKEEGDHA